jgi:hypothetical protein
MKSLKALATTAVFTLGLLAAAWWAWDHQGWWLAHRWASQSEKAPEDQLDGLLDRIARLGEPGVTALVDALASERPELAEHAALAIADEMERWRTLPAKTAGKRLTALAKALADRIQRLDPQACQRAAVIANRILAWPGDDAFGEGEAIAACETVLGSCQLSVVSCQKQTLTTDNRQLTTDLPGPVGGPAVETVPLPESGPTASAKGDPVAETDGLPRPLRVPSADRPLRSLPKGWGPSVDESEGGDGPLGRSPSIANQPARLFPVRRLAAGDSAGAGDRAATGQAAREEILAAIRRLQAPDPAQAAEAEAELRRHGFADRHVALARQLLDPDPATRRRLARLLPEVPGLDAVPWLVLLSRDSDAEVRLTALTLLATTGDPTLLDEVGELVRGDADPRIQRLAERLGPALK